MTLVAGPRLARLALVVCCALLSGYQCWMLVQMFGEEPVSVVTSFTPWEDVVVPSVTVCGTPYEWQRYPFIFGLPLNSTVGQKLWHFGNQFHKGIPTCEPACRLQESVPYPGGRVEVGIGWWESWPSLSESTICHTLTPNVTWSQLAQAAGQRRFELKLKMNDEPSNCDYRLFVQPHRRPVMSSLGVRGVQQDLRVRSLCHDEVTSDLVSVKLISRIIDRESLNRAPCNPAKDYYYESCIMDCAHRQWAEREHCSTPEMLRDFPQLPECSQAVLRQLAQQDGSLAVNTTSCPCLPACRIRSFVADTGVEMSPVPSTRGDKEPLMVRVESASIAEEVTTERRSYRLPSLLSEMGGFVSLVLGVSVLSVVDMITEAIARTRIMQATEPKRTGTTEPKRTGTIGPDRSRTTTADHSWTTGPDHSWTTTADHSWTTGPDHSWTTTANHSWTTGPDHSWTTTANHSWTTAGPRDRTAAGPRDRTTAGPPPRAANPASPSPPLTKALRKLSAVRATRPGSELRANRRAKMA
ncbi:hypothetical protein FJT64_025441 [Amphibalanus amphitrite]|uniref:Uncharacterized protein n=1 Tax=Amphibalanus amphitrite TaxID=1232801 RepID=A0A6A4W567_AMPAM|nr:hypothetical protein FJT64_025441 [Amphibalanus amphitrite]